ncbi:SAM-dependent methyltransferase [Solwaraspora sp. WMMB335]|uniref:SAM-dependent methyltransferase n=1 Tax=Solwaraspora sp. WMMB335 TaxID=3404118 RepID=UPI003B9417FE
MTWRDAIATALYGPRGFYVTGSRTPARHFRTSAQSGTLLARAVLRLVIRVDQLLGRPGQVDLVDLGAGGGELLAAVHSATTGATPVAGRLRLTGVDLAPRPAGLPDQIRWRHSLPHGFSGLLIATEWLDNVPLDVSERVDGQPRYRLVDPATGIERPGGPVTDADAAWLTRWWPALPDGGRAEIGRPRDEAWADAVRALRRGAAVAVDYGHRSSDRPPTGTLTGFRAGREVAAIPDGTCDITAHVAVDSAAAAGASANPPYGLLRQRDALHQLGVHGRRPPLATATADPHGYLAALSTASAAAELTDPHGLGGHWWLVQPVGLAVSGESLLAGA